MLTIREAAELYLETLTYQQKLTHLAVRPVNGTDKELLGKIGEFGRNGNLADDEHYKNSMDAAHAYGKEKFRGKYEITHVDQHQHKIRGGSVAKVRKLMKENLEESKKPTKDDSNEPFNYQEWKDSSVKKRALPGWGKNGPITKMVKAMNDVKTKNKITESEKIDEAKKMTKVKDEKCQGESEDYLDESYSKHSFAARALDKDIGTTADKKAMAADALKAHTRALNTAPSEIMKSYHIKKINTYKKMCEEKGE